MNTASSGHAGLPSAQIITSPTTGGGVMRALFQSMDVGEGRAEVIKVLSADADTSRAGGGGPSFAGADVPAFSVNMGWAWVIGVRPVCKTKRVIGAADGTSFFVRSTATLDQFFFVGPSTSRVLLRTIPSLPGRPPVAIDATHPYAECSGGAVTVRGLIQASPLDGEFMSLFARAKAAATAAGLIE